MSTVHDSRFPVHFDDVFTLPGLDLDPFVADEPPPPPVHTDRAWLDAEADDALARDDAGQDSETHVWQVVAEEAQHLSRRLAFHRHDSAASYLADRSSFPADLSRGVRLPDPGERGGRSPLASALDVQAAWYLQLDTLVGELLAHHLLMAADDAEDLECETAEDLADGRAARWAAQGADLEEIAAAFDPFRS